MTPSFGEAEELVVEREGAQEAVPSGERAVKWCGRLADQITDFLPKENKWTRLVPVARHQIQIANRL